LKCRQKAAGSPKKPRSSCTLSSESKGVSTNPASLTLKQRALLDAVAYAPPVVTL